MSEFCGAWYHNLCRSIDGIYEAQEVRLSPRSREAGLRMCEAELNNCEARLSKLAPKVRSEADLRRFSEISVHIPAYKNIIMTPTTGYLFNLN